MGGFPAGPVLPKVRSAKIKRRPDYGDYRLRAYPSCQVLSGTLPYVVPGNHGANSSIINTVEMVGSFAPPLLRRHRATTGTEGHTYHDHGTNSSVNFYFSHPTHWLVALSG